MEQIKNNKTGNWPPRIGGNDVGEIMLCPGDLHLKPIVIRTEVVEQTNHHYLRQKGTVRGRPAELPETVRITLPRVDALRKPPESG